MGFRRVQRRPQEDKTYPRKAPSSAFGTQRGTAEKEGKFCTIPFLKNILVIPESVKIWESFFTYSWSFFAYS